MANNETVFLGLLEEYQSKNKSLFEKLEKTIRAEPYMEDRYGTGQKMYEFGFHVNNNESKNFEHRYCLEILLEKLHEKNSIGKATAQFKSHEWCYINNFKNGNGILCIPTLDRNVLLVHYGGTNESYSQTVRSSYEIDLISEIDFDKILKIIIDYNRGLLEKSKESFFTFEPLPIPVDIR